jgi:hypothetical protein
VFPHNKSVKKLRDKISRAKEGAADEDHQADVTAELNGNGDSNESEDGTFWYLFCVPMTYVVVAFANELA